MSKPHRLSMMLAMDKNKLIGNNDAMPWHIPGEQLYFKEVTMGKPIIQGRKTFDSIGKPLPGRPNFVVTRNTQWSAEGVTVCHTLENAIAKAGEFIDAQNTSSERDAEPTDIMIIGGAGLCREAMPITDRIYLTYIENEYEGDVWFDSFEWSDWTEVSRKDNEHEGLKYSYYVLDRLVS